MEVGQPGGLAHHAAARGERLAVVDAFAQRTYAEFAQRVNRLARALRRVGADSSWVVAAVLHNRCEWLELLQAVGKIGARLLPVGYRAKAPEIAYLLADSGAQWMITENELAAEVEAALATLGRPEFPIWVVGSDPPWRGDAYEQVIAAESGVEAEDFFPGGGFNVLVYTSGTTGKPKGIERPFDPATAHEAMAGLAAMWGFAAGDVHLVCGPLYHTAPASYAQAHLWVGATVVLLPRFDPEEALRAIERYRVTTTFMVPTHFVRLLQLGAERLSAYDLSSLRLVLHAAAPCPVEVKRRILEVFPEDSVVEFYGASESGFTKVSAKEWRERPGTVGKAWPGHELRVYREDGSLCAPGEVGLVFVRAPHLSFRYRHADDKTAQAFRDGFFTAGDLGYLDEDGYLFLVDRRTDLILSGGANVYPAEVEEVLQQHPDVADAAVVGVPDAEMGKRVIAVVERRTGTAVGEEELIAFARARLADYKCPRRVVFVAALPREPTGKIRRHELAEQVKKQLAGA
jgi:long-chain acyl-CoA synthetase